MFFCFKNASTSAVLATALGTVKTQPTLDRITLGLYKSAVGFAMITASTFAASAVLRRAPRFPGFSVDSATRINGFFVNRRSDNCCDFVFAKARQPSKSVSFLKMRR